MAKFKDNKFLMNRRKFLSDSGLSFLVAGGFISLPRDIKNKILSDGRDLVYENGFNVLQGLTTETYTQLTVDVPLDMDLKYQLVETSSHKILPAQNVKRHSRTYSPWAVDRFSFEGIRLGETYKFQIIELKKKDKEELLDERFLKALDRNKSDARISILSCMLDLVPFKSSLWKSLELSKPDLVFFVGDTVYGDITSEPPGPKTLWRRFMETRRRVPFYHMKELIPCLAVWDDHDYGRNDAGYDYPFKASSLEIFNTFFAQDTRLGDLSHGPGVSTCFSAFGHDFLMADNRYFRNDPAPGYKAFWGQEQFDWIHKTLSQQKRPLWLIQGSQFFGGYSRKKQSYEKNYDEEFSATLKMLSSLNRPLIFVSGDLHYTELINLESSLLGFPTFEITSSCIHSFPPKWRDDNPRRRMMEKSYNHICVDLKTTDFGAVYKLQCLARNGKIKFSDELELS